MFFFVLVTVGCLILQQRYRKRYEQYLSLIHDISSADAAGGNSNLTDTEDESDLSRNARQERRSLPTINEVENRQIPDIEDLLENQSSILGNLTPRVNDVLNPDPEMCPSRFRCRRENCHSSIRTYQDQHSRPQHHVVATNNFTTTVGSGSAASDQFLNRTPSHTSHAPQRANDGEAQILKHVVLCILLLASMFTGLAVSVWTLVMEKTSGIYVELAFLDATLNCGQGLIVFAIFGTHFKDLRPIMKVLKRAYYWMNNLLTAPDEEVSFETKFICDQFVMHHVANCEQAISANKRSVY